MAVSKAERREMSTAERKGIPLVELRESSSAVQMESQSGLMSSEVQWVRPTAVRRETSDEWSSVQMLVRPTAEKWDW